MNRRADVRHEFVVTIPERLEDGTIYVSIPYATALHLCCCGCQSEIVTPLSPTDWSVTFNGRAISLWPSIGNLSFPCQSHYWIERNQVRWARRWTATEIAGGRQLDAAVRRQQYADTIAGQPASRSAEPESRTSQRWRLLRRVWRGSRRGRQ